MRRPLVSVVIAVNKDRGRLRPTIESVLNQSLHDLELIVVDDGSRDGTVSTLANLRASDPRIFIIRNDANLGLTKSLHRGVHHAQGRYIARIDEGDIWLAGKLEMQVEDLERHQEYVIVGSQYRESFDGTEGDKPGTRLPNDDASIRRWLFSGLTPMIHPSIVFRAGTVNFNVAATTSQDFELFLRLSLLGKMKNLPEELVIVWRGRESISASKEETQFFNHLMMHRQFLDVLRGKLSVSEFVENGADFSKELPWFELRKQYMLHALAFINRLPARKTAKRLLKNLIIPDFPLYFIRKKVAPLTMRRIYNEWVCRA